MVIGAINNQPLISVIMPAYNAELYLADAIDSIRGQTHRNLELIIVDGSAHNKCEQIASAYSDPRIRYFRRSGEGLVAARNFGVEQAQGSYIANLDADDIALPSRLSTQLLYLRNHGCQMCGSWMKLHGFGNRIFRNPVLDEDIKFSMLFFSPLAGPTILGETTLFKANPYRVSTAEDYDLWARLAQRGVVFGNIPAPLVKYRMHPLQTSVVKFEGMVNDSEPIAKQFAEYYLPRDQATALAAFSYGTRSRYSKSEAIELCAILFQIARERIVSHSALEKIVALFFRKVVPMNPAVLFSYLKTVRRSGLSLFTSESLSVGVLSLLSLRKDSPLFGFLKKFSRS